MTGSFRTTPKLSRIEPTDPHGFVVDAALFESRRSWEIWSNRNGEMAKTIAYPPTLKEVERLVRSFMIYNKGNVSEFDTYPEKHNKVDKDGDLWSSVDGEFNVTEISRILLRYFVNKLWGD